MKKRVSLRSFLTLVIIAAIVTLCVMAYVRRNDGKQQVAQTVAVARGTVVFSVSGSGVLEPITTVEVKSNVGGQIIEMPVEEGDYVKAGQLIARIDPSDSISNLEQVKADYAGAVAKVDQAKYSVTMQTLQTDASLKSAQHALESAQLKLAQTKQEAEVQPKLTSEAIAQAKSALESAQSTLDQTKSALVPQKLASAKAAHDEAMATFDKEQKNLERQNALFDKGYIASSQLDDAQAQFASAKAQLDTANKKYETIKQECQEDIRTAESKVSQAKSALETAKANSVQDSIKQKELAVSRATVKQALASLQSAQASVYENRIKSDDTLQAKASLKKVQAALTNAKTQLGYTTVVAPRDGVIVKKYTEAGSIITAGRQAMAGSGSGVTIVDIADVSHMRVVVDVDETDVSYISMGQQVDVTIDAIPDQKLPGKVIKIAPQAEVTSNVTTVPVTVELEKTDSRLKPEMNASCDFLVSKKDNVLYLPIEAVTDTDNGRIVTVLNGNKIETRTVQIGLEGNDYYEIVSGVSEGEQVIIPEETPKNSFRRGPGGPGGPGGPPPF